jgi:hypothetical protein
MKCGFVEIERVHGDTFHSLLSEFYLRPVETEPASEAVVESTLATLIKTLSGVIPNPADV